MCSQPPKVNDEGGCIEECLRLIPLIDRETAALGVTGGEPTLEPEGMLSIVRASKAFLPETALHVLSNGRMFAYLSLARALGAIRHPDLVVGVPLHSDLVHQHDWIAQRCGAFYQTVRGIVNLRRCGIDVEVRVVIHNLNVNRLLGIAEFIARNMPFVRQVAMMGMESIGLARRNLDLLWVDPYDYRRTLRDAVEYLTQRRMRVVIYNHQLCTLDHELWRYCCMSISDWKREYLPICAECAVRTRCGGFFAAGVTRHSEHIHPQDFEDES
jgi:His-Xaa-Ser system radical SAM maturase HxsC